MIDLQAFALPGTTWQQLIEMNLLVFGASLLQGIGGVGLAMVAAPISVLLFPQLVPAPILLLGSVLALMGAIRERSFIVWPAASLLVVGRIIGAAVAGATLSMLPTSAFAVIFALLILCGVAFSVSGWKLVANRTSLLLAGTTSGLMGTITSSGAPPLALVMQHVPPPQLRATISSVFVIGALISLVVLAVVGRFGMGEVHLALVLLPAMTLGFLTSGPLKQKVTPRYIRAGLLGLSAAGAIGILLRTWAGL